MELTMLGGLEQVPQLMRSQHCSIFEGCTQDLKSHCLEHF
uniref:Uncharacterized protein n=1 Tax=Arundo donax TaxID=35708 RepID=A0A0A9GQT2_ARUDO